MKPPYTHRLPLILLTLLMVRFLSQGSICLGDEPVPYRELRTPEELLTALARCSKPDWTANFRGPLPSTLNSRFQTAILIGSVFTDGYLAAQAEDAQQCKNVVKDLVSLAKTLGVQNELLDRSRSLSDSAQKKSWAAFRQELGATEAELENTLRKHQDERLVRLVILGSWMRGLEISASVLKENYSETGASFLRHKTILKVLSSEIDAPQDAPKPDPLIASLRPRLETLRSMLEGPQDAPLSSTELKELAAMLASILLDITTRQN
jgi:hypothetical protein